MPLVFHVSVSVRDRVQQYLTQRAGVDSTGVTVGPLREREREMGIL